MNKVEELLEAYSPLPNIRNLQDFITKKIEIQSLVENTEELKKELKKLEKRYEKMSLAKHDYHNKYMELKEKLSKVENWVNKKAGYTSMEKILEFEE